MNLLHFDFSPQSSTTKISTELNQSPGILTVKFTRNWIKILHLTIHLDTRHEDH